MRILDRYILKNVISLFFTCLFTFLSLYIISDVFTNLSDILKHHVNPKVLAQYYLSFLPIIFVQVTPFSCLLSVLYTFGKLNRNNEIIAMRSSGLSIYQITKTVIIFGVVTSVFVFWINDRFVPRSLVTTENIRIQMSSQNKKVEPKETESINNLSMYGMKNRLFFVTKFSLATNSMEGITILEHDEHQNIVKKIVANKGVYKDGLWRFYQCITYDFDENSQIKNEPRFLDEEVMSIPETPREFLNQRQRPEYMTIAQIDDYIWKLSRSGATGVIRKLKVDLYQKYTMPLTAIIIILLAIPFSLKMKKRATGLSSLGLSIMVGFLYYVANAISVALGYAGILMPLLAVSLSHIIVFMFSIYLIDTLP